MTHSKNERQTAAQRKAAERKRRESEGLKRLELYAKPINHARIKAYAKRVEAKEE